MRLVEQGFDGKHVAWANVMLERMLKNLGECLGRVTNQFIFVTVLCSFVLNHVPSL